MATPTITLSYYTGAAWVDISAYRLHKGGAPCKWGMPGNKHNDRMARTGEMRLLLENGNGRFDPEDANALAGWGVNTKVKLVITFDSIPYNRFYGTVQDIQFSDVSYSDPERTERYASVTVADWMHYAYKFPLRSLGIETHQRGGYAIDAIVDAVGQVPLNTNYSEGDYVYDALFDSVTNKTKAATEINKIVMSEWGYFYNKHDRANGETLVFEAAGDRPATRTVSKIPQMIADSGHILIAGSATDYVLDCAGNRIIPNMNRDADMDGVCNSYSRSSGKNILNDITITAYPKRVDSSEQTLYSLGSPLQLAAGETKTFTATYQNLSTKESCNAITDQMIQPVATTDYLMNKSKLGSSTNLTANLTVVAVYRTAEVEFTVTNGSAYTAYITMLKCRGYGVYQDSSIKAEASSSSSKAAYSDYPMNIEQQYQRDTVNGTDVAWSVLGQEYLPRTKLDRVSLIANKSDFNMLAFLNIDIGDIVTITESSLNIDGNYYVQGIEFNIIGKDVITFDWILQDIVDVGDPYSELGSIEFIGSDSCYVFFNSIFAINNINNITVMCRMNADALDDNSFLWSQTYGWGLQAYNGGSVINTIAVGWVTSGTPGFWKAPDSSISTGTDYHVAYTLDKTSVANNPIIYIDGSAVVTTEVVTPTGSPADETDSPSRIGYSFDGKISDIRVFNRILSAAEIASEYATPGTVTSGLIFKAFSVWTFALSEYDNLTMSPSNKVFDTVAGHIGTPAGSPISQLP